MKKLIASLVFLIVFISQIHADRFQLFFRDASGSYAISYASVKIFDANDRVVFDGVTDKYGRVNVGLNTQGNMKCVISYRGSQYQKEITVKHCDDLTPI